jgi:hypothetical protein
MERTFRFSCTIYKITNHLQAANMTPCMKRIFSISCTTSKIPNHSQGSQHHNIYEENLWYILHDLHNPQPLASGQRHTMYEKNF